LAEETQIRPKPMVEIGGMPILWHIMKNYAEFGVTEFVVCLGYKGFVIKEFFANYFVHMSDVTFELNSNNRVFHGSRSENWKVTLVETGESSQTGRRLRLVREYLNEEEDFCFTYGDGLTNSDISDSINFHRANGRLATLTAVTPKSRYGAVNSLAGEVQSFSEKPEQMEGKVNGGFFVLNKGIFEYLQSENLFSFR
jgi:glucose-1-phosphate cytidylyltransferase